MPIRTVIFDFMGTCLDWHSSIIAALPQDIPEQDRSSFALQWRQTYFDANTKRIADGLPTENIDVTHSKTWDQMLTKDSFANYLPLLQTVGVKDRCMTAWHSQQAWPDVAAALQRLRDEGYEVVVHANGTRRLQLDLCRSSGLQFDALFSFRGVQACEGELSESVGVACRGMLPSVSSLLHMRMICVKRKL